MMGRSSSAGLSASASETSAIAASPPAASAAAAATSRPPRPPPRRGARCTRRRSPREVADVLVAPRAEVLARAEELVVERLALALLAHRHRQQREHVREERPRGVSRRRLIVGLEGVVVRSQELEGLGHGRHRRGRRAHLVDHRLQRGHPQRGLLVGLRRVTRARGTGREQPSSACQQGRVVREHTAEQAERRKRLGWRDSGGARRARARRALTYHTLHEQLHLFLRHGANREERGVRWVQQRARIFVRRRVSAGRWDGGKGGAQARQGAHLDGLILLRKVVLIILILLLRVLLLSSLGFSADIFGARARAKLSSASTTRKRGASGGGGRTTDQGAQVREGGGGGAPHTPP